jgi:hypothetical protein
MDVGTIFKLAVTKSIEPQVEEMLLNIHPRQVINLFPSIPMTFYRVLCSYKTKFGVPKESVRYFVENTASPENKMEEQLLKWANHSEKTRRPKLGTKRLKSESLGLVFIDPGATLEMPVKGGLRNVDNLLNLATRSYFHAKKGSFCQEQVKETFHGKVHPKQIVVNIPLLTVNFYEVVYEYQTQRIKKGEQTLSALKQGTKILIEAVSSQGSMYYFNKLNLNEAFNEWVQDFNNANPMRPLLNVEILNNLCIGSVEL